MADDFVEAMFATPVSPEAEQAPQPEQEATLEPTPETVAEPTPAPEPTPEPEPRAPVMVPLDVVHGERERRQAVERERDELRRQVQQQAPQTIPDSFDDPEGFAAYQSQQIQSALRAQKLDLSYTLAVRDHGQEKVEAARQWALEKAKNDPIFDQQVTMAIATQTLPVDWLVQQHKRDALLSDVGDNVDDWFTREAVKRGYVAQSAPAAVATSVVATPAPRPAMPPRSIAGDASPTRAAPSDTNPMAGLDAIFQKR